MSMNNSLQVHENLQQVYENAMDYLYLQYHGYAFDLGEGELPEVDGPDFGYYGGMSSSEAYNSVDSNVPVGMMVL